jgi:magnesium transporter
VIVDCAVYEHGLRRPGELALTEVYDACHREDGSFVWIGLHEPTAEEFDSVHREFELHELAVEDAITAHQRPKLELYDDTLLLVLKTARWAESETIEFGEILLLVGSSFLVSTRHGETRLHDVRLRMEERPDLLRFGPSAALYAIVDRVVDDYEPVVDALDTAVKSIEREVFSDARSNPAERIYRLKREVLELHGVVVPLLEPIKLLSTARHHLVDEELLEYFRDIHDHLLRIAGRVQEFRDLLTSVLTANLTQASVRQNEDVRRISAWAAIVAVPTAIAGIYGMNFDHMPELSWGWGYPLVLAAIVVICAGLYRSFRRAGWL